MLKQLNDRLLTISELARARDKLRNKLEAIDYAVSDMNVRQRHLRLILDKELVDVEKLENLSITALFHTLLGSKEKQLDKERQEYLAAKLNHDEVAENLEDLRNKRSSLTEELKRYAKLDEELEQVLLEKESIIRSSDNTNAQKLIQLSESLAAAKSDAKEMEEAVKVGETAHYALCDLLSALKASEAWGTLDMLTADYLYFNFSKREAIDKAKAKAQLAQREVCAFNREVADVKTSTGELLFDISNSDLFIDTFFDCLIADWCTQSRIVKSIKATEKATQEIKDFVDELRNGLDKRHQEIISMTSERRELLVSLEDAPSPA